MVGCDACADTVSPLDEERATCRADRGAGAVEHLQACSTEAWVAVRDKSVFEDAVSKLACILYRDCKE